MLLDTKEVIFPLWLLKHWKLQDMNGIDVSLCEKIAK